MSPKTPSRALTDLFSGRLVLDTAESYPDQLEEAKKWAKELIESSKQEIEELEEYFAEMAHEEHDEDEIFELRERIGDLEELLEGVEVGDREAQHRLIMRKTFDSSGEYIRRRLLEVSFANKVIPPRYVPKDGPRKISHDALVKIVDVEPQSKAMAITFRGQPTKGFASARAEIDHIYNQFKVPRHLIKGEDNASENDEVPAQDPGQPSAGGGVRGDVRGRPAVQRHAPGGEDRGPHPLPAPRGRGQQDPSAGEVAEGEDQRAGSEPAAPGRGHPRGR